MVDEGRKILRNLQRVAKLFVTKSAFAAVLVLSIGLTPIGLPAAAAAPDARRALAIGIPGFFLALAPSGGRIQPAGSCATWRGSPSAGTAAGSASSPATCSRSTCRPGLVASRTVATTVLVLVGLYLILALEAEGAARTFTVLGLCAALAGAYVRFWRFRSAAGSTSSHCSGRVFWSRHWSAPQSRSARSCSSIRSSCRRRSGRDCTGRVRLDPEGARGFRSAWPGVAAAVSAAACFPTRGSRRPPEAPGGRARDDRGRPPGPLRLVQPRDDPARCRP